MAGRICICARCRFRAFAYDSTTSDKINFEEKLLTLKNILSQWTTRNLTLIVRICIVKTLEVSKLDYNTSLLKVPPKVSDICLQFIWNFKPDNVKRQTIVLPVDKGGLNMVGFTIMDKPLKQPGSNAFMKLTVVNRAPSSPLLQLNTGVPLSSNVILTHRHDLNLTSHVSSIYRDILTVWHQLHSKNPSTAMEYKHETIWNNRFITIDGKPDFLLVMA